MNNDKRVARLRRFHDVGLGPVMLEIQRFRDVLAQIEELAPKFAAGTPNLPGPAVAREAFEGLVAQAEWSAGRLHGLLAIAVGRLGEVAWYGE